MYPRTEYEMTQEDFDTLLKAMKPVPMIMLQCGTPPSQQENANRAWAELGKKMGFDSETVQPIRSKGDRWFSAVPSETDESRDRRLAAEKEAALKLRISELQDEIFERQKKLTELLAS